MAATGSDEFDALIRLLRQASEEAVLAAEDAASKVYQKAIQAAAPVRRETEYNPWSKGFGGLGGGRPVGQLKQSVKVIEGKPIAKALTGRPINRRFVGPEKEKGFYGYFVDKGHKAAGPRRIKRTATNTTHHSQSGVESGRFIPAHPWFDAAVKSAEADAINAAQEAFNAKLDELDRKG